MTVLLGSVSVHIAGITLYMVEWNKMRARLRPWQATYRNLIQDLLGERKLEEAVSLLHLMRKSNYPPYPEPFLRYISKFGTGRYSKEGRHLEARDLLYKCPLHIRKHQAICSLFGSVESTSSGAA
ncbi:hypothetical protein POM88_008203 [Heracleum sosnowskyi]|uniref:Pentatricopeptide repeat-containing protein n=1 Tax=Heracleum sosnowskyi TaxID=360622 RepID=A0AAD8N1I3_9APIA|nr:hypothetical protein POM88_008203 [Heracleum sosnowskyi]